MGEEATPDGPARRRASWSLKTIVEDVAGRPVHELQDPDRPAHPYWRGRADRPAPTPARPPSAPALDQPDAYDPVGHLYPPLVGAGGREFHGPEREHHAETLDRHRPGSGVSRASGPSSRPERLYLHYLLLHLDRLNDSALRYLRHAVDEEIAHRAAPPPPPEPPAPPAPAAAPVAPATPAPVP